MKKTILIISIVLLAMQAYAQHDEQVTVEGKYRPKVNKVDKLRLNPETPEPTYVMPNTEVYPKGPSRTRGRGRRRSDPCSSRRSHR